MKVLPSLIDANVPCQAGKNAAMLTDIEDIECAIKCNEILEKLINNPHSRIVLDDDYRILHEYDAVCRVNMRYEPNTTTVFKKWVYQNLSRFYCNGDIVELHEVGENEFQEYPDDPDLVDFDPHDKKYVAVAHAHPDHPHICNATDTDWWPIRDVLSRIGIKVDFVSEAYILKHLRT